MSYIALYTEFASTKGDLDMRKVTFGGANSLDNFIARKNDAVDWLMWNEEVEAIASEFWQTIDTVVMGRKTYEVATKSSSGTYPGMKNYVFSRTLQKSSNPDVQIVSEDAADVVRRLKHENGKGICIIGGGVLARSLFEANLIDEIGFNIHPVLLGSGIPLFYEMSRQIKLELLECKTLNNGCVVVRYKVISD
jgi:dihydrofolate reductase